MWNAGDFGRSEAATVLAEAKEISKKNTSFNLSFRRRSANVAAHLCAKQASYNKQRCLWINITPPFLVLIKF
jgi:hypothetical protein